MLNRLNKPQYIFAFFSLLVGLVLVFITPVIENDDESQHLRRVSEISEFIFLHPEAKTEDPLSIWADSAWFLRVNNVVNNNKWHFDDVKTITAQPPEKTQLGNMSKNAYALNSPLLYLPLAMVLKLTKVIANPEYWVQFYLLRTISLLVSVALITSAIARIPEHKTLLAATCLLPTMLYNRSGINIDGIVIGCTFHFLITIYNLSRKTSPIKILEIFILAFWGFLMAQGKGAYMPLLFATCLLPKGFFTKKRNWCISVFLVVFPAIIFGLGWSIFAKNMVLKDLHYNTVSGNAWPDGQFEFVITHPFIFMETLLRTFFTTSFIPRVVIDVIAGHIGWYLFFIPRVFFVIFIILLFFIFLYEPVKAPIFPSLKKRLFLLVLTFSSIIFALLMLYVQWNGYKQPIIEGFQGRYLYPLLPIFVIFAKPDNSLCKLKNSTFLLIILAFISSTVTIYQTSDIYYFLHQINE
jgi:uncharacterized membrane protein